MARHQLSEKKIAATKATATTAMLPDGDGLYLRIKPTGSKTWVYAYDIGDKQRRMGLGSYPTVTLSRARVLAEEARVLRAAGVDPLDARQAEAEAAAKPATVAALFEQWITADAGGRADGGAEVRRSFEKDVLPRIGDKPVAEVRRADILAIGDAMRARGVSRMSNVVLSDLRQMWGFALDREIAAADPTARIKKTAFGGSEHPRERALSEDEIGELYHRLPAARLERRQELLPWLLLATGNRVGETTAAEWKNIDFEKRTWFLPAATRKGNRLHPARDHTVHLSGFAVAVFISLRAAAHDATFVFPARKRHGESVVAVCEKSATKQYTDRQQTAPGATRKRRILSDALALPGGRWTPHDLRRTARTMMSSLGVAKEVAERCVGHVEPDMIVRTYDRHRYAVEQRAAWDKLGKRLEQILSAAAENRDGERPGSLPSASRKGRARRA